MTFSTSLVNKCSSSNDFFQKVMLILRWILSKSLCPVEPSLPLPRVSDAAMTLCENLWGPALCNSRSLGPADPLVHFYAVYTSSYENCQA